jgi:hypothetical protein
MQYAWTCACCGKQFSTLPLDVAFDAPVYWHTLPEGERATRAELDADFCILDGKDFFVRGILEIPVMGLEETFGWGVWSSLSKTSLDRVQELWDAPVVENEPPRFGWLSNAIPIYPDTWQLKTSVHLRGGGLRPRIKLVETDHPLYREQRDGITVERVLEIVRLMGPKH